MTSTNINVGLSDNTRSSSRVLRPPGGGHTDIFGGEAEPVRGKKAGPPQTDSFQEAKAQEKAALLAAAQNGNSAAAPEPAPQAADPAAAPIPAPAPAPAPVSAPEPTQDRVDRQEPSHPKAEAPKPQSEPAKRVRVPPGGFSSGLW